MTVEERLTVVEKELAELKQKLPPAKQNWIAEISGSFKNDPDFGEILRLGREIRDSEVSDEAGKQITSLQMASENPWLAMAGIFDPNDPLLQEWQAEMANHRTEFESDENRP